MECIVLAGGFGTRIQSEIGHLPKCMAPIAGKPFLHYLLQYLAKQKMTRVVLSLGYQAQTVQDWLTTQHFPFTIDTVVETEPLGTGGAIIYSLQQCSRPHVAVVNGDTLFQVNIRQLLAFNRNNFTNVTLALKPMTDFDRYGVVNIDAYGVIQGFEEKKPTKSGLINGGVYAINRKRFLKMEWPTQFSFEKDYLEARVAEERIMGLPFDSYFLDIGIPQDYQQAQTDFKKLF